MLPVTSQYAGVFELASAPIIRAVVIVVSLNARAAVSAVHAFAPPPLAANAGDNANTLNNPTTLNRKPTTAPAPVVARFFMNPVPRSDELSAPSSIAPRFRVPTACERGVHNETLSCLPGGERPLSKREARSIIASTARSRRRVLYALRAGGAALQTRIN
jgi:hypothetical protein